MTALAIFDHVQDDAVSWKAPPIEDYGLIGDTRTAALVASSGSIDWLCVPRFDSQPLFGRLIGGIDAGYFEVAPAERARLVDRRYVGNTATLRTTWSTERGSVTLTDGMVADVRDGLRPSLLLVRHVEVHDGEAPVRIDIRPRLGGDAMASSRRRQGLVMTSGSLAVNLQSNPPLAFDTNRSIVASVTPEQPLTMAMTAAEGEPLVHVDPDLAWGLLRADTDRWRQWVDNMNLDGLSHSDVVARSMLVLRLLTYSPSGAPVAAPTTSLPEWLGGSRNWDYRYAWPRDASIGLSTFLNLGSEREALLFMRWLVHATRLDRPRLNALLSIHGRRVPKEQVARWPGYAESSPVRFGNAAAQQHQLDGYGWVLDAAWLLADNRGRLDAETWRTVRSFAGYVTRHWHEPDAGIWEERGPATHHVHSKLMAWLALDRAIRIADLPGHRSRRVERWRESRNAIARDVVAHGYDPHRRTFTRRYGSTDLDAAVLVLPLLGIEPVRSERTIGTIAAIRRELGAGGPLLYRYLGGDGLPDDEGAFLPCSFWLVQALALTGAVDHAHDLFDQLISLASPLGLLAEEIDPSTRRHLGNYPQALTHAALVQAALALRASTAE